MKQQKIILYFLVLLHSYATILATMIGSSTAVFLEPYIEFSTNQFDNKIFGFAWIKNGFGLEDFATTCTFDVEGNFIKVMMN